MGTTKLSFSYRANLFKTGWLYYFLENILVKLGGYRAILAIFAYCKKLVEMGNRVARFLMHAYIFAFIGGYVCRPQGARGLHSRPHDVFGGAYGMYAICLFPVGYGYSRHILARGYSL